MSWLQWCLLVALVTGLFEVTYRRIEKLLVIRGYHEDALSAVVSRQNSQSDELKNHDRRLAIVERELHLR